MLSLLFCLPFIAQQPFEVASIKPFKEKVGGNVFKVAPNGDLRIANMTLREMVRSAYFLHETQLFGGPQWFDSDRWAIEAKVGEAPPDASSKTAWLRMKKLLDERFQLVTHRESRMLPVLVLMPAKGGHRLKPAIAGEERKLHGAGHGMIYTKRFDMPGLASVLSAMLGRIVQDQTGLAGEFAFDLQWTFDAESERLPGQPADFKPTIAPGGPSIYSALQDQLGLRLVSKKMPVEAVIVDRAIRPTEN